MDEKQKCTNCKCNRLTNDFIGIKGNILKRCVKCRDKDSKRKLRPDIQEKARIRNNTNKYYIKHRENKRLENEEEYLKHNAENMRNWCKKNKKHLKEWRTKNFCNRFYSMKSQAQIKGIVWNEDLTDEICYKMMTSNCFYCDFITDKTLNGIDRMDSAGSYEKSNTVSCCKDCNFIKGSLDPNTFIKRCNHISKYFNGDGILNKDIWSDSISVSYMSYKYRSIKKKLPFKLLNQDFFELISKNCYYCNKENSETHENGIDRKDNSIGYVIDNCVSCCGQCNQMKGVLSDIEYINICKRISTYNISNTVGIETPEIVECIKRITKREKHEIIKEKIIIIKQQPNKKRDIIPPAEEYIPIQRTYTKGSNLPEDCPINSENIPKYCYYIPVTLSKGDGFCCSKSHPKHTVNWYTTKSKKISIQDKLQQLLDYIKCDKEELIEFKNNIKENIKLIPKLPLIKKIIKEINPLNKINTLSTEQLLIIMNFKSQNKTTQDVTDYIKENYQIYIKRDIISKLWKGELQLSHEIQSTIEYNNMINNKKLKTVRPTKFTTEELIFLKTIIGSLSERCKIFTDKFNKTITKAYISKLDKK